MAIGFTIQIDVLGERQINRRLLRFTEHAANMVPVWAEVEAFLIEVEKGQFSSAGRNSGHPWDDIKDSTKRAKARSRNAKTRANSDKILMASEKLYNSLTKARTSESIRTKTPSTMIFGTKLKYGRMHQSPGPAAAYPRRRPVDLTERQKVAIVKAMQLWISRGVARGILV
jgi:phage gpG-like protein